MMYVDLLRHREGFALSIVFLAFSLILGGLFKQVPFIGELLVVAFRISAVLSLLYSGFHYIRKRM